MSIPDVAAFGATLSHIDHSIALWFHQHLTQSNSVTLCLMSDPGSPECVGALTAASAVLLTWRKMWQKLATLLLALPGGMLVNEVMKTSIRRPRPFDSNPYIDVSGFSFPSGHTMAATLIYGLLAVFVISFVARRRHRWFAAFAASALAITVGFSRIALGAHYLTDVLAGMAVSIAWLYLSFAIARRLFVTGDIALNDEEAAWELPEIFS